MLRSDRYREQVLQTDREMKGKGGAGTGALSSSGVSGVTGVPFFVIENNDNRQRPVTFSGAQVSSGNGWRVVVAVVRSVVVE